MGEVGRVLLRIPEETEATKAPGTDRKIPPTLRVEVGALPVEGLPVEDLPDLLDHQDLPEVEETGETTTLGEVGSFARCANNSDTKRAIPNVLASSCCASCVTLRGTT